MTTSTELQEKYRQEQVSFEFLARHKDDFNNCEANVGLIKDFFQKHQLEWSLANLERAFFRLKSKLAPVPGAVPGGTAPDTAQEPPPPPISVAPVQPTPEPSGLTMQEINSWDGPTMRKKMADPVKRKQIDACLTAEAERLRQRRQTENQ